jgi:hypothetical protein
MKKGKIFIPYLVLCMMMVQETTTAATFSACGSKDKGSGETTENPLGQKKISTTTTTSKTN